MDIEDNLDSDFLFYLDFTKTFINQFREPEEKEHCRAWLAKLCGQVYRTIEEKRNRNILLSQLVLCMEDGKLKPPFNMAPDAADMPTILSSLKRNYQYDDEEELTDQNIPLADIDIPHGNARTYVATRAMPGGEGAFAYIALSLGDEPHWLGAGEGFDRHMEERFKEMVPPLTEMEQILLKRKDPEERKRVLAFYDALIDNIDNELDGNVPPGENRVVNGLLEQLTNDLINKGTYEKYGKMAEAARRVELLTLLHERLFARRTKVSKREQYLDSLECNEIKKSFFENSAESEDKHLLPAAMWEQAINREPSKKNMKILYDTYPKAVIAKFIQLLSDEKELIAINRQRRHENIVTQMKKELRKEVEFAKIPAEKAKENCDEMLRILKLVKAAYDRVEEYKKKTVNKYGRTDQSDAYDQMRQTLFDTQKNVEEEAHRGQLLAKQINDINNQTEEAHKVNMQSIRKIEESNMILMQTIQRLQKQVQQHQTRLQQVRAQGQSMAREHKGGESFFV